MAGDGEERGGGQCGCVRRGRTVRGARGSQPDDDGQRGGGKPGLRWGDAAERDRGVGGGVAATGAELRGQRERGGTDDRAARVLGQSKLRL